MVNGKFPLLAALLLTAACSGGNDENLEPTEPDAGSSANVCAPAPARFIVLGDSIAACFGDEIGGKDAETCGPKAFHTSLATSFSGLSYENLAVSGAVTSDVVDTQLATVPTGTSGHAVVLIYIGGNDLQGYLTQSDADAVAGLNGDLPGIIEDWNSIFAFFNDTANFPDGATILMNNQYNPFDDCTAPPWNLSQTKSELLWQFNGELSDLADAHDNAHLTDQYTPYLGHGHHYNVASCPHYQEGLELFMGDLIHPNAAGHAHLAEQWDVTAARIYDDCE